MKNFSLILALWILACIGDMYMYGIRVVIQHHKMVINCLLLIVTIILSVIGCYTNVTYSSKCKIGERVDGVILSRDFSPGSRSAEWYYEYEIDIADEDTHVTAYSSKYYKEGDIVTCYVATSDVQKERKSIIEGSNECKKGNRLLTAAVTILTLGMGRMTKPFIRKAVRNNLVGRYGTECIEKLLKEYDDILRKILKSADNLKLFSDDVLEAIVKSDGYADSIISAINKYGDDAAKAIVKYGDDAAKVIENYGKDAIDYLREGRVPEEIDIILGNGSGLTKQQIDDILNDVENNSDYIYFSEPIEFKRK